MYSKLRVIENDYLMLDDFLIQVKRLGIKLDKADADRLSDIVSSFGIRIDEEFLESIAQHLEDFLNKVTVVLKDFI